MVGNILIVKDIKMGANKGHGFASPSHLPNNVYCFELSKDAVNIHIWKIKPHWYDINRAAFKQLQLMKKNKMKEMNLFTAVNCWTDNETETKWLTHLDFLTCNKPGTLFDIYLHFYY